LPSDALRHATAAIEHLPRDASPRELANAYSIAASAHEQLGNLAPAVIAQRTATALCTCGTAQHTLAMAKLGDLLRFSGDFAEAEELLVSAVATAGSDLDAAGCPVRATALNALGIVYKDIGRYHAARAAYSQALTLITTTCGPDDPASASLWHNIAGLAHARGQPAEAAAAAARAVAIRQCSMGATHRLVALDLAVYGAALLDLDRVDDAESAFHAALDIFQSHHPADRYEVAVNLNNLAACQLRRHDPHAAEDLVRASLTIKRAILGDQHPEVARLLNNLAIALAVQGRTTEADRLQHQALDIAVTTLPPQHPLLEACRHNTAAAPGAREPMQQHVSSSPTNTEPQGPCEPTPAPP